MKSAELEDMFSEERTRERMEGVVNKGQNHLTQVPTSQYEAQICTLTMVELFALGCSARLGIGEACRNTKGREVLSSTCPACRHLSYRIELRL